MDTENGLLSVLGESLGPSGVAEASRELEESMGTTRHRYDDFKGRLFILKHRLKLVERGSGQKPTILTSLIFEGQYMMFLIFMCFLPYFYNVLKNR
jgi:hypothetical protein